MDPPPRPGPYRLAQRKAPRDLAMERTGSRQPLDALLMNIFCCRRTLGNPAVNSMLGVPSGLTPQFGYRPGIPLHNGKTDRTEIDMKLGDLMVEGRAHKQI